MTITAVPLLTTEHVIRECFDELGAPEAAIERLLLDLPALAAAFSRRLRGAGLHVTPSQCELYARSLGLTAPESRTALYWTTRSVFVTDTQQVAGFDRVFRDVFGAIA